jgi:hypothetical protein
MIYTITMIRNVEICSDKRCVGYYEDLERAKSSIENNVLDMREDGYNYGVIEFVTPGIYSFSFDRIWYKWNGNKFEEIPCPDIFKSTINFSMG